MSITPEERPFVTTTPIAFASAQAPPLGVDLPQQQLPSSGADNEPSLDFFRFTPVPTIILDSSIVVRQVSDSYLELSAGCTRNRVLGQFLSNLLEHTLALPSLSSARTIIEEVHRTRKPCTQNDIQPDGTVWTLRAIPIYRHERLQYIQLEITNTTAEHKRQLEIEKELHTNETFRLLVQSVIDYAIFLLDKNGNVATWNEGAQRFKGYTQDEIIGKHFSNFYCQEDRDNDKPGRELADALRDGRVEDEGWRYRKDGSRFWANVIITPIYRGETLLGFVKVTRDLTERRKVESDLIAAYEESSKLKSEFLANMSHEIRTPMHGMLSALTLLLDTSLNDEQMELARVIEESGEVLVQVINDILDYSKLTHGGFSISHDTINVADIIQSVYRMHKKSCPSNLELEIYLDPKLPTAAEGDSLRYRQIIQNLLSNAMKFTEDGYVHVRATLEQEDQEGYTIITEVADTGVGIPPDASKSLFKPFVQFDNSATKRYKGTGLGLSICKSLSELMDGHIGFRPNPDGRGSIFWFTANLKRVQQSKIMDSLQDRLEAEALESNNAVEEMRPVAAGKSLLLAEDNPINQKVMLKMLKGLGFENVGLANDGRQAVAMSSDAKRYYDIILMDINMPVLDGVGATKELRNAGIHTPIVAMTANALKGQAESYLAKGITAYISKPVDRRLLVNILLRCLKHDQ